MLPLFLLLALLLTLVEYDLGIYLRSMAIGEITKLYLLLLGIKLLNQLLMLMGMELGKGNLLLDMLEQHNIQRLNRIIATA